MKVLVRFCAHLFFAAALLSTTPAWADVVGKVTSVTQGAFVVRASESKAKAGVTTFEGDGGYSESADEK